MLRRQDPSAIEQKVDLANLARKHGPSLGARVCFRRSRVLTLAWLLVVQWSPRALS